MTIVTVSSRFQVVVVVVEFKSDLVSFLGLHLTVLMLLSYLWNIIKRNLASKVYNKIANTIDLLLAKPLALISTNIFIVSAHPQETAAVRTFPTKTSCRWLVRLSLSIKDFNVCNCCLIVENFTKSLYT